MANKMANSFDDFDRTDRSLCPRCHTNKKAGAVSLRLNKFADGNPSRFEQVTSRQVSLCEECTVNVYGMLVDYLNDETNGGTRKPRSVGVTDIKTKPAAPRRRRRTRV